MVTGVANPNKVRSVLLLTDGLPNSGFTEAAGEYIVVIFNSLIHCNYGSNDSASIKLLDLLKLTGIFLEQSHSPHNPPISLHTLGYGPEPNQSLLRDMAKVTEGGTFYSVPDNHHVASAFGDAIGGMYVRTSISIADAVFLYMNITSLSSFPCIVPFQIISSGNECRSYYNSNRKPNIEGVP